MEGVEGIDAVRARGRAAIDRVVTRHRGGVVACISHGGLINAVLGSWLGVVDDMWFVPWHTGISAVLLRADRRILLTVNDAAHLGGDQDILRLVAGHVRG
jgi:broad specificity phosphatase PhoE